MGKWLTNKHLNSLLFARYFSKWLTDACRTPQLLQQQYPHQYAYDSQAGGGDYGNGGDEQLPASRKKNSTISLVNARAYWPYPSAVAVAQAQAQVSGHAIPVPTGSFECQSPGACSSSLEFEAMAAVHRLSVAVREISVSEMLPRTPQLIFVNVTTLEGQPYCLELTAKGWRITSLRTDCMQGDFTRMELFTVYYESVYDLMSVISPSFKQHADAIASRRSRSSCGDDEPEEEPGTEDLDLCCEGPFKSASASRPISRPLSRRPSLTPLGVGAVVDSTVAGTNLSDGRRLSLKLPTGSESHLIQLCPQCCCVSLTTPAGESLADMLEDSDLGAVAAATGSSIGFGSASALGSTTAAATGETATEAQMPREANCCESNTNNNSNETTTRPCRCGHRAQEVIEEAVRFPRRKLRNISEGAIHADEEQFAEPKELDSSSSSGDELKFSAESSCASRSSGSSSGSGLHSE